MTESRKIAVAIAEGESIVHAFETADLEKMAEEGDQLNAEKIKVALESVYDALDALGID